MRLLALVFLLPCGLILSPHAPISAQETEEQKVRIDLLVSASTDRAVFVEKGSSSGIRVGDRVSFHPPGQGMVEGVVRAVTANHARIELLDSSESLPVGTRAEIWVELPDTPEPSETGETQDPVPGTDAQGAASEEPPATVDHPPWRSPPEEWNESMPLLSSPTSTPTVDRERSLRGRFWGGARWRTTQLETKSENAYLRGGLAWTLDNAFARGGQLVFGGEMYTRYSDNGSAQQADQDELRLSRFYYQHGGHRDAPRRWLLGRFYQRAIPEFGVLDGIEFAKRLGVENEFGLSVGHMPPPDGELADTQDYQAAIFHRHRSTKTFPLDWRLGYQRTWHEGQRDRDLLVFDTSLRSEKHDFFSTTAWIDYYESTETAKDDRVELTRLFVSAGRSLPTGDGVRLYYSEFRFPLILRQEFDEALDDSIFEEHNTRAGLEAWTTMKKGPRLRARLDRWADDDLGGNQGLAGELRCDVPRALPWDAELGVSLFGSQGEFSSTGGLRLSALGFDGASFWNLYLELSLVDEKTAETASPSQWQNEIHGSYDTQLFNDFSLALDASAGWGDQGDTLSLGLYLQRSF